MEMPTVEPEPAEDGYSPEEKRALDFQAEVFAREGVVATASTIKDLCNKISDFDRIEAVQGKIYSTEDVIAKIRQYERVGGDIRNITSAYGIRMKVAELCA